MTVEQRRDKIAELRKQLATVAKPFEKQIHTLLVTCPHKIAVPSDFFKKLKEDKWHSASANCLGCGAQFGWFCPKSKDNICDYEDPKNPGTYDPDHCRYCGMPTERK